MEARNETSRIDDVIRSTSRAVANARRTRAKSARLRHEAAELIDAISERRRTFHVVMRSTVAMVEGAGAPSIEATPTPVQPSR